MAGPDQLDPAVHPARDAVHSRRILAGRQGIADAEQELRDAVKAARDAGDSWTVIVGVHEPGVRNRAAPGSPAFGR